MIPDAPSAAPLRRLALPRGPLEYTDEGEGPALICVHGLPGSTRDFRWLPPATEGLRVIRLSLPGFGGTPERTGPGVQPLQAVEVLRQAADALELSDYALLGHSFGGVVATAGAADDPRVRALALVCSVGPMVHRGYRSMPAWQWRALGMALRWPVLERLLIGRIREGFEQAGFPSSTTDAEIARTLRCAAEVRFDRHAERLDRVRVPTLVAWTEDDPLVEPAIARAIVERVPDGPRIEWADGGHNPQKAHALELGEALSRFLGAAAPATSRAEAGADGSWQG